VLWIASLDGSDFGGFVSQSRPAAVSPGLKDKNRQ
jgi:hypothetical protein